MRQDIPERPADAPADAPLDRRHRAVFGKPRLPALLGALGVAIWLAPRGAVAQEQPASAFPPDPPGASVPSQGEQGAPTSPRLSVAVSDPDGDPLTVAFYGRVTAGPDFTIIPIPDTQYYTGSLYGGIPAMLKAQTQWIVAQRGARNIVYAVQLGDCVEHGQNWGRRFEWQRADTAFHYLEDPTPTGLVDGIPYGVCVGNHDQTPYEDAYGSTPYYNQYFGAPRFLGRGYYGGHFANDNDNWFDFFSASGMDFIVISFEYDTTATSNPAVLHWADSLLTAYPDRRAIVTSHALCNTGVPAFMRRQGRNIYGALKAHPGLFLMLCGHVPGEGRRQDVFEGRTVHTVLSDYQSGRNGGDGWMRIMEFSPANNAIRVRTYSPWLDQWEADADSSSQFTLSYDMAPPPGFQLLGTVSGVPSGGQAEFLWPDLNPRCDYEWYVTMSDDAATTTGPTWTFRTTAGALPDVHLASPNGAESLAVGSPVEVRWSASDPHGVHEVDLLLSRSGIGGPWEIVAEHLSNTGSFTWTAGGSATSNAYFKVVAMDGEGDVGRDASDSPFSILAPAGAPVGSAEFALRPVAPNPTRGGARVVFELLVEADARVEILDVQGRLVAKMADGRFGPGRYERIWPGAGERRARSGLYFVRMSVAGREFTRRFLLLP